VATFQAVSPIVSRTANTAKRTMAPGTPPSDELGSPGHDGTQLPFPFVHTGGSPPCVAPSSRQCWMERPANAEPVPSSSSTVEAAYIPTVLRA
jgi:hypothetical protein